MARHAGRNGRIYISPSAATPATLVSSSNEWTLDMDRNFIDVTAFGDANKTVIPDLRDLKGSVNGFWDDTDTVIDQAEASETGCNMILYPDFANNPGAYWYGTAYISFSLGVEVSGAIKRTGKFAAKGSWTRISS